jgi:hypothetical protein
VQWHKFIATYLGNVARWQKNQTHIQLFSHGNIQLRLAVEFHASSFEHCHDLFVQSSFLWDLASVLISRDGMIGSERRQRGSIDLPFFGTANLQ